MSSDNIKKAINDARDLLTMHNPKEALKVLKPFRNDIKNTTVERIDLLQIFIDVYLENGKLDKAYPLLLRACELDPQGKAGGYDKFFTLGQIAGGKDGISIVTKGIENISVSSGDTLTQEHSDMIVNGLLTMIEIWMTDLCMEPEAEGQCEELISKALEISDSKSPEAWSMLGSIRISQQRYGDAAEAFRKAWEFFEQKKMFIEDQLKAENSSQTHAEFIELLQPLTSLAKMCIELGLYDLSLNVVSAMKDIDEDNLESLYLEGFTYYLLAKLKQASGQDPGLDFNPETAYEFNERFQEFPIDLSNELTQSYIYEARVALSFASKIAENAESDDEISRELFQGTNSLLQELGGPMEISELMRLKQGEAVDDDEEIQLEDTV